MHISLLIYTRNSSTETTMAFNQTQFFEDLEKLTTKVIDKNKKDDFIYDFLTLLDVSKSTITSLKKNDGRFNEPPRLYRRVIYLSQAAMPDRVKLS